MGERVANSTLRRWCPYAKTHQDVDDVECGHTYCVEDGNAGHNLRKRRMLVCSVVDCEQGYFNREEFDAHECYSAY